MTLAAAAFASAHSEVSRLVQADADVLSFGGWPSAVAADVPPQSVPAVAAIKSWKDGSTAETEAACAAIREAADFAHWRQTYSEDQVGADFLTRYGWFELMGPAGHLRAETLRACIAYWGPHLHYPEHVHEAEELYFVLAGEALFEAEGLPPATLRPGQFRIHRSHQPHAMTTGDSGILTLVLWRGPGMSDGPRLGTS